MNRLLALAVVALLAAGCGDNLRPGGADARPQFDGDVNPDAPPANSFTAFVHNQILTNTSDSAAPVPYATFAPGVLPDPDATDTDFSAYADLF